MNASKLTNYRSVLQAMRARVDRQVEQIRAEASLELADETPFEPADLAAHVAEITVNQTVVDSESHLCAEIDAALERIAAGTFGRCERCDGRIAMSRLHAVPYARYCIRCERTVEHDASAAALA